MQKSPPKADQPVAEKLKEVLFRILAVIFVGAVVLFLFWWGGNLAKRW